MKTLYSREEILAVRKELKAAGKKVVFTNGCFDILHAGHVDYLSKAKETGDILIIGLNSDASVRRIKGEKRPVVPETERAYILANLKAVDYVSLFDEDTPFDLINDLIPDILVKGADWSVENIVGRDVVENHGGEVKTIEFVTQQSTTSIIDIIKSRYC